MSVMTDPVYMNMAMIDHVQMGWFQAVVFTPSREISRHSFDHPMMSNDAKHVSA